MPTGIFTIVWRELTSSQIPFDSSDSLTGTYVAPKEGVYIVISDIAGTRYNSPDFIGITITTNSSKLTVIHFGEGQEGKRLKLYITFSNTTYEYEVQVWGYGDWALQNPGSGPSSPNAITFGDPVGMYEPFTPNETDPTFPQPAPEYSPFIPRLLLEIDTPVGDCILNAAVNVKVNPIATVAVKSAAVYKDALDTGTTLQELLAGKTFTAQGFYEVRLVYEYLGDEANPGTGYDEILTETFEIEAAPFPHIQRENLTYSAIAPGGTVIFPRVLSDDHNISYDSLTGEFELNFCGEYFIKWFVVPQTGLAAEGANFTLLVNGQEDSIGAAHICTSPASGTSIVRVYSAPPLVKLVNASGAAIELSHTARVKAGIVIFRIGVES